MNFTKAAYDLENCIVAIVQKFHAEEQPFPEIWGTGFFVSEHGVVCTCKHVLDKCLTLPCPPDYKGLPFWIAQFREFEVEGKKWWGWLPMKVISFGGVEFTGDKPAYVEDAMPDVAFLLTEFRGTPSVSFAKTPAEIGEPIGFSGYPMGLRPLLGHKGFQQGSSTLHAGIVAAIHPHRLATTPYGFLVHANTQRGASGSPVFRPDGSVVGMVYMIIPEFHVASDPNTPDAPPWYYEVPTALTGCLSAMRMHDAIAAVHEEAAAMTDRPLLSEKMKTPRVHGETANMERYVPKNSS
jgi:hypothetical protein